MQYPYWLRLSTLKPMAGSLNRLPRSFPKKAWPCLEYLE